LAARCGLDAVHALGRLDRTEADHESAELKFDVLGDAIGRNAERLSEAQKIAVEVQSSLDVARVEVHETSDEHVQQYSWRCRAGRWRARVARHSWHGAPPRRGLRPGLSSY